MARIAHSQTGPLSTTLECIIENYVVATASIWSPCTNTTLHVGSSQRERERARVKERDARLKT